MAELQLHPFATALIELGQREPNTKDKTHKVSLSLSSIENSLLLSVLLLDPRGHVKPPRDGYKQRPGNVQRLDGVGRYGVQDVCLVDAVRACGECHQRHHPETSGWRLRKGRAEHIRRRRLTLPVGVEHHRGGRHRGGSCLIFFFCEVLYKRVRRSEGR